MSSSVTATFVFTDLVDSTATAARLGPAAAEELRQTHFRLLRGAVAASGGTEVKNLGDGLMVMYSSPSRALSGAAGMQQAIEHHNRSADEPFGVRIGMSVGEAVEEDDDYFGDPVVEAARLCAAAQGGQILATDVLRAVVGRHATQTFVDVGPLELKGLPDPVDAVEVVWEPAVVEGSIPLPGRACRCGVRCVVRVLRPRSGDGGAGRGLQAGARRRSGAKPCSSPVRPGWARPRWSPRWRGRRTQQGPSWCSVTPTRTSGSRTSPGSRSSQTIVRHGDPEALAGLRSAQRGALARLVPEIGADADRVREPDTERLLLLEGAVELLAAESQRAPLVVVLDDLHWADTASLQLLRHVIASTTPMDVTVACTYRDTDLGRGDALNNLLVRPASGSQRHPPRARRAGGHRPRRAARGRSWSRP